MAYMAKWGPMGFVCSTSKIIPLMDLKVTMAVKSESQSDSSGTSKTNVTGKEPEVIGLATRYVRAAGVDPWARLEEWRDLLGKSYPLYIGGRRFGPAKMMLKNVEASEILNDNAGNILSIKVTITLEENSAGTTTAKTDTTSNSEAMSATAPAPVRNEKKLALNERQKHSESKGSAKTTTQASKLATYIYYEGSQREVIRWEQHLSGVIKKYHPVIMWDGQEVVVYSDAYARDSLPS